MKNFKFLFLSALFLSIYAFQCEDDCSDPERGNVTFDINLSSTSSNFSVGDELSFFANFPTDLGVFSSFEYNLAGEKLNYNYELFEVNADNKPVTAPIDAFDITSSNSNIVLVDSPDRNNSFIFDCEETCVFDIKLALKKEGYYGLVLRSGSFYSDEDCVKIDFIAEKETTNNFSILEEINTHQINYSTLTDPMITETNSFFFKVE